MTMESRVVDVKGRPTEVLVTGAGEPLVFFHGAGIIEGFDPLEALADRFTVYIPLMPGYGATDPEPPITDRQGLVDNIGDVLDTLGIEKAVLVGHSFGGWRVAQFIAQHPERVSELVLGAPFGLEVPDHPTPDLSSAGPEQVLAALTNDLSIFDGRLPTGPDPEFMAAREREGAALGGYFPGPFDAQLRDVLPLVGCPTLILWGDDDRMTPTGHLAAWHLELPHASTRLFPDTGHLLFHERPEAVAAIAEFVDTSRSS